MHVEFLTPGNEMEAAKRESCLGYFSPVISQTGSAEAEVPLPALAVLWCSCSHPQSPPRFGAEGQSHLPGVHSPPLQPLQGGNDRRLKLPPKFLETPVDFPKAAAKCWAALLKTDDHTPDTELSDFARGL